MRILRSSLRKLARRPATWVTGALLTGLLVLIIGAVGTAPNQGVAPAGAEPPGRALLTFPGAYDRILTFMFGFGGLLGVVYGAAIAGSEWTWGTFKVAVSRGESRWRYVLGSYAAIAVVIAVGLSITFAVGVAAAYAAAHVAGISTAGIGDQATLSQLPLEALRGWLGILEVGAIGFAIASLARSQLAGIGIGLAFFFGETFAGAFLPDVVKYLPFAVARAATGAGSGGFGPVQTTLPQNQALVLVAVWLVGALLVAAVHADRAEITG
ncbi:MAG TPA: ABC transporter permease subunit [Candidatus Limnocylindrales bacterium]|nr:ABC transporter permease subunit [Candidatus Limnocylindrales bacterium]